MGIIRKVATVSILLFAFPVTGLQQRFHTHTDNKSAVDPCWSELESSMKKMHVAMSSVESSGNSDVDFVRLMLPHHQAAIDMAKTQLRYGSDPQIRRLAQEIITDQQLEIELMQLWLKEHSPSSLKESHAPRPGAGKEK